MSRGLTFVFAILLCFCAASSADAAALRAPRQISPADGARVLTAPSFSWAHVPGAATYEFQLSADPGFRSIVLGQGPGTGSVQSKNTFATVGKTLPDGDYFWRVRAITARGRAGRWSPTHSVSQHWSTAPGLVAPARGAQVRYPHTPLVLRWAPVPYAYKYLVTVATDPSLSHSALSAYTGPVETSATAFALPGTLAAGRYYWAVTPLDAEKHPGARSAVSSFDWVWPTATTPRVTDLIADPRVFDPQFSWDPIPGAAQYQVEVNSSADFAAGSRVCCDDTVYGTSLAPRKLLPNNTYYWRVRAIDLDGNAGSWNRGPEFNKTFDEVTPTIPRLRVRDNKADATPAAGPSGLPTSGAPVVAWDPVPGASSYEGRVAPFNQQDPAHPFCDWTSLSGHTFTTATTAWTPLASIAIGSPVGNAFTTVAVDSGWAMANGVSYCIRVRARSDRDANLGEVVSAWTQLGGSGQAAFTYAAPGASCYAAQTPATAYHAPQQGSVTPRMPLFTWDSVPGACGYYVVVARDPDFTKIVDVAYTNSPAYAPRGGFSPTTYSDETTSYYWAVMPTVGKNGTGLAYTSPQDDNPQSFQKRSTPPRLLAPAPSSNVLTQPSFRWTPAEGARDYRIQVDDDPTFGSPIDDVVTDATAYTSASAYPADTVLYWRVRANDENHVGLTWSQSGTFRRRLPIPHLSADNPLGGLAIPTLSWTPVQGAVSYSMHVEQADGTKRDFTTRSTALTPVVFYGTGVWHWQVRADFKAGSRIVSGGYSAPLPFTRVIATPAGLSTSRANSGVLLSWQAAPMAREYRVQISTTDSFSTIVEQGTTDNTSYAPTMTNPAFTAGVRLYWRVAVVDEGLNVGGWATSRLVNSRPLHVRLRGSLRRDRRGRLVVTVTGAGGRRVAGARVTVAGSGLLVMPRRTGRRGTTTFRLHPRLRGKATVTAMKPGYIPATARMRVR